MIQLAYPPTTNNLFSTIRVKGKEKRIPSQAYTAWKNAAGWELKAQKPTPIKGRFHFSMVVFPPDKRRRDLDNLLKAPLDLLKTHGVIEDDSLAQSVKAEWAPDSPMMIPAHVVVTVEPA